MIYKFTTVKTVIAKVYRDLDLQEEFRWQSAIEWIYEALQFIGSYAQHERKVALIPIENHSGMLPCDFIMPEQVSYNGAPLQISTNSFMYRYGVSEGTDTIMTGNGVVGGYYYDGCYIRTTFEEGTIEMAYLGFKLDDDGFPMIPDEQSHIEAITRYVIMKSYYPRYLQGALNPNIYQEMKMDWNWYCQQARNKANMPNLDQMEAIKNGWLRLMPSVNEHARYFDTLGDQERLRVFNIWK